MKHANGQHWLYSSQGTVATTQAVKQLDNGGFITDPPASFTVLNGKAYFVARSGNGAMPVLWESDGTTIGTKVVAGQGFFDVSGVVAVGSTLYLSAQTQANGWGIWQHTPGGGGGSFGLVQATRSAPDQLRAFKGQVLYRAIFDNVGSGHAQLALGTQRLTGYDTALGNSSQNLLVANDTRLFFTKTTAALGTELWESDGTAAGTQLVRDINHGPASSNPASAALVGDEVFFAADDGTHGRELWRVEAAPFAELSARILTLTGTASSDRIAVTIKSGQVRAYLNGQMLSFPAANVSGVLIDAGDGNDWVHGNGGIDQLYGEDGDDIFNGHSGRDYLDGGLGRDTARTDRYDTRIAIDVLV